MYNIKKKIVALFMSLTMACSAVPVDMVAASEVLLEDGLLDDASLDNDTLEGDGEIIIEEDTEPMYEDASSGIDETYEGNGLIDEAVTAVPKHTLEYSNEAQTSVINHEDEKMKLTLTSEKDLSGERYGWIEVLKGQEREDALSALSANVDDHEVVPVMPLWIGVIDKDGHEVENLGRMTVRIEMESAPALKDLTLYHQKADKTWETIPFKTYEAVVTDTVYEPAYVTFMTESFSPFIFARLEEKQATAEMLENIDTSALNNVNMEEVQAQDGIEHAEDNIVIDEVTDGSVENEEQKSEEEQSETAADTQKDTEESADEKQSEDPAENIDPKSESADMLTSVEENEEDPEVLDVNDASGHQLTEVDESAGEILLKSNKLMAGTRKLTANLGAAAPPTQEPVTEDGMTIEKIVIKWLSRSNGSNVPAGYGTLELMPTTDDVTNQQWQLDFAVSGKHEHEAGSIEIVMPAYIWKTRNGKEPGILTLAVPEDPEKGSDFAWKRIGDTIVFTNTHNISAASKIMIQGTFREVVAHEMVDLDVANESAYINDPYKGHSDELYAVINLETPNGSNISMTSNSIDATISTYARVAEASKTAYNPSTREYNLWWEKLPDSIPSNFLPENPEDYCYVRWYVSGRGEGNQPYDMYIDDTRTDEYGCIMLGVQGSAEGNVKSPDGISVHAKMYSGYTSQPKSAYIWTAYPKSAFPDEPFVIYTVHNTQTITVVGVDDLIETTKQATAPCSIAVPIEYTVVKEWDDNDNELGLRPSYQYVRIYRNQNGNNTREVWKDVKLVENPTAEQREEGYGEWSYTWSDEGKAWHYETDEIWFASGSFETWYDEDGNKHTRGWHYGKKSKTYDPDERKWVFVNTLGFGGYDGDFADMWERVWWQYDDPYLRSTRDRALNELLHNHDAIIPYDVWGIAGTVDTWLENVAGGKLTADGPAEDAHLVDIVLEDYLDMVNNQRITVDDVDLAYIDIVQPKLYGYTAAIKDPSKPESDPERYYDPPRYTLAKYINDYTNATFEAYINGTWVEVGELHGTVLTGKNGARASGTRLTLPDDTEQVREIVHSYGAATELKYTIGVRVHPTDWIKTQINNAAELSDYMMMAVDNFAQLYGVDQGKRSSWTLQDWDRGYLHGRVYRVAVWQDKTFRVVENDVVHRTLRVHTKAKVTQQSNVLFRSDYDKGVEEGDIPFTRGGTWYDLLPPGVEPIVSSVKLQSGDKIRDVRTVENYKNSGRTLLIVEADLADHVSYTSMSSANPFYNDEMYPKEGYKQTQVIEFDSYYSWEDVKRYGLETTRNTIAFETDDDEAGTLEGFKGEPDDPDFNNNKLSMSEVRTDKDLMKDLDAKREDPSFVYAGADMIYDELDFYAEASIRKWVQAEGSGLWSYGHNNEVVVTEGGKYTYRINIRADSDSETKDIIILDSLENYVPTSDKNDYGDAQWRGYFLGLNIEPLKEVGIAPVVYYSTTPNLDISRGTEDAQNYNYHEEKGVIAQILETSSDWVRADEYTGRLDDVTAFAIDCRYKADGSEFSIRTKNDANPDDNPVEAFQYYVYMRAPAKSVAEPIWGAGKDAPEDRSQVNPSNPDHNAHAYNNIFLDSTQIDPVGRETHAYIHWDYVKVGIIPFNLNVHKVWDDMDNRDGKQVEEVTVHLYADGVDTGKSLVLNEGNEWSGSFDHVLRYDYDTKEESYNGLDDGHYIEYTFVEDPVEGYETSIDRDGENITLYNTHVPEKIDVPFTKTWEGEDGDTTHRPDAITVKLYANGIFTGSKQVVKPDIDGNWAGVFKDLYKYENGQEVVYTIEEERVDSYLTTYDGYDITNTYHPMGDLQVTKELENATNAASENEFTFTLLLTTAEGDDLTDKYQYEILQRTSAQVEEGQEPEYEKISEGEIGNGDEFKLKGGQKLYVKDIPVHAHYRVSEARKAGFMKAVDSEAGEILTGVLARVDYTNNYSSRGRAEIKAWKKLTGRDLEKNQFKFDLYRILDDESTELVRSAANKEDGSVLFGSINYTHVDDGKEFTYRIVERNAGKPGYTYDANPVIVKVYPRDNGDGTMSCEVKYFNEAEEELSETEVYVFPDRFEMGKAEYEALSQEEKDALVSEHQKPAEVTEESEAEPQEPVVVQPTLVKRNAALFTNEYHAEGEITLRAWKQLIGRDLTDGEFSFELLSSELEENGVNKVLQTKTNVGQDIVFDPIQYDEEDVGKTFYYFVREIPGNDDTVVYDDTVYGYSVYVVDNGDGTLSFSQKHVNVKKGVKSVDENTPLLKIRYNPLYTESYGYSMANYAQILQPFGFSDDDVERQSQIDSLLSTFEYEDTIDINAKRNLTDFISVDGFLDERHEYGEVKFNDTDVHFDNSYNLTFIGDYAFDATALYDTAIPVIIGTNESDVISYIKSHPKGTEGVLASLYGVSSGKIIGYYEITIDYDVVYEADTTSNDIPLFTNTLKPGSLTITKLTQWHAGDEPDPNQEFKFKIKLINPDGTAFEAPEDYEYIPEQVENIGELPAGNGIDDLPGNTNEEAGESPASESEANTAEGESGG